MAAPRRGSSSGVAPSAGGTTQCRKWVTAMATPALTPSTVGPELRLEGVPGAAPPDSACLPEVVADVPRGTAGAVVLDHVALQVKKIKANVPLVRADAHDAVHQMRVGARRLRSALTTFRPLLDRDVTDGLRGELRWSARFSAGPATPR